MDLRNKQEAINKLAQQAVIAGLRDDAEYEERANTIISGWLWTQHVEATEDNIYLVRADFDYYTNACLEEIA